MKKKIIIVTLVLCSLIFCGYIVFDHILTTPMVKVVLKQEENISYYIIDNKGNTKETDEFETEDVDIFNGYFESEIVDGKIVNKIADLRGMDENGNTVEANETTQDIMLAAAKSIHHDILVFTVMHVNDDYYVYTELNVNLWTPCELYKYDTTSKKLKNLHTWDGQEVIGISTDV